MIDCRTRSLRAAICIAMSTATTAFASEGTSLTNNPQCPELPTYISNLAKGVPDVGGSPLTDETASLLEPLGTNECPSSSSTQCDKLAFMSFMFALMDMDPPRFRRYGMAAFVANLLAEDVGLGDKCSAENLSYSANTVRKQFPSLPNWFCKSSSPGYNTAKIAGIIDNAGNCDVSDGGLARLRTAIIDENPNLAKRTKYVSGFAPIVTRIYRYKLASNSDEEAFRFRGRGFIQITGQANYASCQADVMKASEFMKKEPKISTTVRRVTGVDWATLNIINTPEMVSQNRYIAAFCAASYWNAHSAPAELSWFDQRGNFTRIVGTINSDPRKVTERFPSFTKYCIYSQCNLNYPNRLDIESGFKLLQSLASRGIAPDGVR